MKKLFSISALILLLSFISTVSLDAFFCEDAQQKSTQSQAPVHCCVQCCPSHNLASPTVNVVQVTSTIQVSTFIVEILDLPLEIYPNQIDRPPIA